MKKILIFEEVITKKFKIRRINIQRINPPLHAPPPPQSF